MDTTVGLQPTFKAVSTELPAGPVDEIMTKPKNTKTKRCEQKKAGGGHRHKR